MTRTCLETTIVALPAVHSCAVFGLHGSSLLCRSLRPTAKLSLRCSARVRTASLQTKSLHFLLLIAALETDRRGAVLPWLGAALLTCRPQS
jgi:hypothetical protein